MAGDATNIGPTYAMLREHAGQFLVPVSARLINPIKGERITVMFAQTGEIKPFPEGADYAPAEISLYDDATQHNVPRAFASYRQRGVSRPSASPSRSPSGRT